MIEGRQPRVSPRKEMNMHLEVDQRVENLEFDSVTWGMVIKRLVEQTEKFNDYIDSRIKKEEEERKFWMEKRGELMTAGIIGTVGIIMSAIWFTLQHLGDK